MMMRVHVLRSVLKKGAQSKEPNMVDLDVEESVSEQVAKLITHQAAWSWGLLLA